MLATRIIYLHNVPFLSSYAEKGISVQTLKKAFHSNCESASNCYQHQGHLRGWREVSLNEKYTICNKTSFYLIFRICQSRGFQHGSQDHQLCSLKSFIIWTAYCMSTFRANETKYTNLDASIPVCHDYIH